MTTLILALTIYVITIVFALLVAGVIHGLGAIVARLSLERNDAPLDLEMPSADARREAEAVAVAVAVASAARAGRFAVKSKTSAN